MKGFLLAGCATVALAGMCGAAAADTAPGKFDIKLGGDAFFTAGVVSQQGETSSRSVDFANRFRLQVTPSATADNGLQYGASLRLRAWNFNGTIDADQAYVFVAGQFGRIEAGLNQSPDNQYGVSAPNGFGTGGVTGDWTDGPAPGGVAHTWLTNQTTFLEPVFGGGYNNITNSNWSTKVNYFTPRFFAQPEDNTGLMGSVSFAPSNLSLNTDVNRSYSNPTAIGAQSVCAASPAPISSVLQGCYYDNMVEVGLRYDGSFNGVSVTSSLGFEHGDARPNGTGATRTSYNDLAAYQAGLQVGYAGVLVGASYLNAGTSGYSTAPGLYLNDQSTITAGISYETGPVVVGFNYAHGEDAGDVTVQGSRTADLYSVGATYTLAPGLTTSLEYLHSSTTNETGYGADPFGNTAGVGSGDADLFLWKNVVTF